MTTNIDPSEQLSEGMRYGPPEPPELHPNRVTAEFIIEEADGDMADYNLKMLRAQLVVDQVSHEVTPQVFRQNYNRLNNAIGTWVGKRGREFVNQTRARMPAGRKRK